ncbi:MAG TPA: acyl-CoA dehydrogenase family protein [Conexibacter sp.]|nr:acyl-CoA dehydrogenase family protein [Conexibacter sp.]
MNLGQSERGAELRAALLAFMDEHVYPAEEVFRAQVEEAGDPHFHPPIMEELKAAARERGLWNLFLPPAHAAEGAPGLTNVDYAPLAEILGRSRIASEACNCNAPDTGNMETLALFATPEQKQQWLKPLLAGEIRSGFGMTEPDVASSDATNIQLSIVRDGDHYVLNGRKWWTTNALHPNCRILIVMGKTAPDGADVPIHRQQSMVLVPIDTPGVRIVRSMRVFGYEDHGGHPEIAFEDVRVPVANLLAEEGDGFLIGQARLGPGRIHHSMRTVGVAERALELLCKRAHARTTFGKALAQRDNIRDWIAEARIEIEMVRLLTLKAAWLMDTVGNKGARVEIAAIKIAAANAAQLIIDRAIQVHGGAGVSQDTPLAAMYQHVRVLRLADGPDEVHKRTIARQELKRWDPAREPVTA